jgi:hypothetical protein
MERAMNTMRTYRSAVAFAAIGWLLVEGCKKEPTAGTPSAPGGNADSSSASGSGSVSVVGNAVTYQNLHIEVPWSMSDPANALKIATDAAAGNGLKLTDGKDSLIVASDGRSIELNGRSYGAVNPGDRIALTAGHKLMVNGSERAAQQRSATTTATTTGT